MPTQVVRASRLIGLMIWSLDLSTIDTLTLQENCFKEVSNIRLKYGESNAETHPAWFVDLLLVVHDSILPGQVQELQDDGQPSGQKE